MKIHLISLTIGLVVSAGIAISHVAAAETLALRVHYIEREITRQPTLSNIDPIEDDVGIQGARLAIADSNTTGKFLNHSYVLDETIIPEGADFRTSIGDLGDPRGVVVANMPAGDLLALSDAWGGSLILNVGSADNALRSEACRRNVLHTSPSRSMLTDALAQYLLRKKWTDWLLLVGPSDGDQLLGDALRNSARKFGSKIVEDKEWNAKTDLRRDAHEEVIRLTNRADYDVVVVTDEVGDFARYLPYNTYLPRPVAGSDGLVPAAWAPVVEQWGAAQLQRRFFAQAERPMRPIDYASWAAVRSVAEAVTRTGSTDPAALRSYLLSDKFELAAFKGRKLSFRSWNGQLRQPIPLSHSRALVASAPLDGFLHRVTEMDTLGHDRPESQCKAFE